MILALSSKQHIEGFSYLKYYLLRLKDLNAGFEYRLDPPNGGQFNRVMILLPHSINAFPHCFNVVGVDTANMDSVSLKELSTIQGRSIFKCKLTFVSSRTLNNEMLPLAFMLSMTESVLDIVCLLRLCKESGLAINRSEVTVLVISRVECLVIMH